MSDLPEKELTRRGFLTRVGGGIVAANLAGAALDRIAIAAAGPRSSREKTWLGHRRPWQPGDQPDPPRLRQSREIQSRCAGQRPSRQSQQTGAALQRQSEEHLQLPELRHPQRQPGSRRHLHRAAQQHARRIHHPRRASRQARPQRKADGHQRRRLPGDDRRREESRIAS